MEHFKQPLLPKRLFFLRVLRFGFFCLLFISGALGIGIWGYMYLAGLGFVDALLNASMILGGMGPVDTLKTNPAKIFASFYALFSGITFLTIFAMFISPFAHRALHLCHLQFDDGND